MGAVYAAKKIDPYDLFDQSQILQFVKSGPQANPCVVDYSVYSTVLGDSAYDQFFALGFVRNVCRYANRLATSVATFGGYFFEFRSVAGG
jgi:hypothetical protein